MGSWREAPPLGQARAKPSLAPQRVSQPPRAQLRLPVRASSFTPLRPSFLLPESSSPVQTSLHVPFLPKSEEVRFPPAGRLDAEASICGESASGSRTPRRAWDRLPLRDWVPAPGAWGQTQGPDPSSPLYLARSATLRGRSVQAPPGRASSSHCCQPHRATVVLLGPFAPRSRFCPRPPTPTPCPLRQKCHSFSASGSFAKSPRGHQELGGKAGSAYSADALPLPSFGPLHWTPPGRRPICGHRPLSVVRNPLPLPRAFTSRSGCRLPVPRVLISLLMNILTEANAGEN